MSRSGGISRHWQVGEGHVGIEATVVAVEDFLAMLSGRVRRRKICTGLHGGAREGKRNIVDNTRGNQIR